jgi:hypothetical protein
MSLAGDIPVFGAYYDALIRGTSATDMVVQNTNKTRRRKKVMELTTGMQFLAIGMRNVRSQPSPETRVSFYEAFGWPPDMQVALEQEYDALTLTWGGGFTHVREFSNLITGLGGT